MTRTLLPELHGAETRLALAEAVLAVLAEWGIYPAKQTELLGLAVPLDPAQPLPDDPAVLERAGHLLAIERALKRLHPDDPAARHAWLMFPAEALGGRPPLRVMLDGMAGIERVRALLEA